MTTKVNNRMIDPVISTGTTEPRLLEDRLADIINVKDFGAKGDGVTDDTAAVQAALNSTTKIITGSGTFKITGSLSNTIEHEIHHLDLVSDETGTGVSNSGLHTTASLKVIGCTFANIRSAIVVDASIDYLDVDSCTFTEHTEFAVGIDPVNTEITIQRIKLTNNTLLKSTIGFDLSCGYAVCQVNNNTFQYFQNPLGAGAVRIGQFTTATRINAQVNDNIVQDITSTGGTGSTFGIQILDARTVTVTGNNLRTLNNDDTDDCEGIYVRATESTTISGNALADAGAREGQIAVKGGEVINVVGNSVSQTSGFNKAPAISVQGTKVLVSSNIITNPTNAGVWVNNNVSHLTISENYFHDFQTSANTLSATDNGFIVLRGNNPNSTRFTIKNNTFAGTVNLADVSRQTAIIYAYDPTTLLSISHNTFKVLDDVLCAVGLRGGSFGGNNVTIFSNEFNSRGGPTVAGIQVLTTGGTTKLHSVNNYFNGYDSGRDHILTGTPPTDLVQLQNVIT